LMNGPRLYRSEIFDALQGNRQPKLLVLITDCCSGRLTVAFAGAAVNPDLDRMLRNLFLQHQGVVDITAASYYPESQYGESAWINPGGGLFTAAFSRTIRVGRMSQLDSDQDGFLMWKELFDAVRRTTNEDFHQLKSSGAMQTEQTDQLPQAFCLGRRSDQQPGVRYYLGVDVSDASGQLIVVQIHASTPAANILELNGQPGNGATFVVGDVIKRVNGQPVSTIRGLHAILHGIPDHGTARVEGLNAADNYKPYSAVVRLR
jgi:hypothetical protein